MMNQSQGNVLDHQEMGQLGLEASRLNLIHIFVKMAGDIPHLCCGQYRIQELGHTFRLRRTTNRILASSCCSSNVLGSVNVCGFEPDQVKVRVKDGKVCVSAERENRYDCLGSKKYSYMNICKEFSLPPCVDEKDVTYSYGLGSCVKIESPCYPCTSPCNPCDPCSPCDPCNPCYPCGSRFSCRKMIL
ncbi:Outer dense fiber protein 1, partial [Eschrichtius robustus]|nr:Outer dense fiber protein 1 [Eschrichtius robustus]